MCLFFRVGAITIYRLFVLFFLSKTNDFFGRVSTDSSKLIELIDSFFMILNIQILIAKNRLILKCEFSFKKSRF